MSCTNEKYQPRTKFESTLWSLGRYQERGSLRYFCISTFNISLLETVLHTFEMLSQFCNCTAPRVSPLSVLSRINLSLYCIQGQSPFVLRPGSTHLVSLMITKSDPSRCSLDFSFFLSRQISCFYTVLSSTPIFVLSRRYLYSLTCTTY